MQVLALIPARGGSKGIPRKNLVDVGGAPLLVHSVRHALAAQTVTRVVVSTEDEEIARVAAEAGAEVPFLRPPELALDHVLDLPVFRHAIETLERCERYRPDLVVHLRPTCPARRPEWIDRCVELLRERPDAHSVRSVSPPAAHPYRVFRIGEDGLLDAVMKHEHPEPWILRRQDHPPMWHYNCVIDVTRTTTLLELESMTGSRILPFEMRADEVVDVDEPRDLELARWLFETGRAAGV